MLKYLSGWESNSFVVGRKLKILLWVQATTIHWLGIFFCLLNTSIPSTTILNYNFAAQKSENSKFLSIENFTIKLYVTTFKIKDFRLTKTKETVCLFFEIILHT